MDIYIWNPVPETMTRLTFEKAFNLLPIWTPDGKRIVFSSDREGYRGIYWKSADGTGVEEKLGSAPDRALMPWCWSSDGKTLVIVDSDSAYQKYSIGTISMEGDHIRKPLLKDEFAEANPNTSRDGKYMAYISNESGHIEVYVRPFPDVNKGKWQISSGGGDSPLWSPDGRELFYLNGDSVMAVSVETEPTFNCGKPRVLFKGSFIGGYGETPSWDISPDGKRFLMMKESQPTPSASAGPHKINIVLNWTEELKQRVPVK
jgi:Tol biopolymer transport system component